MRASNASGPPTPPPVLGIVDLGAGPDWELLRPHLAACPDRGGDPAFPSPVLAFGPHKDVEAMRAAKAAGVTRLVSNGEFHRELAGLVARSARTRADSPSPEGPGTD